MNRKLIAVFLLLISLLLAACGTNQPAETQQPVQATAEPTVNPDMQSVLPGSDLKPDEEEPTETPEPIYVDEEKFEEAKKYIDQDVSKLYAAIGEPEDSSYAPSCMGPGEDGELYYEGFTVATYRDGDKEIVRDVNINAN